MTEIPDGQSVSMKTPSLNQSAGSTNVPSTFSTNCWNKSHGHLERPLCSNTVGSTVQLFLYPNTLNPVTDCGFESGVFKQGTLSSAGLKALWTLLD